MQTLYSTLLEESKRIIAGEASVTEKLQAICDVLENKVPHYDWVGFYFAEAEKRLLHLGPYTGEATDHTVIPFGKGICGQVAESNQTFLVEDVMAQSNYIACSMTVKSEIVVPLFVDGVNIGQIDIDSHTLNAFTEDDQVFLETLNETIASLYI
ncbi:GAF domain-containing protein [Myroides sp. 1354]|uniref:GAF domain-containing protein n=1 Tax=unclassified Myroides TaxID=2642485 RepID=UPI002576480F|nr:MULTISPECIES: GAF domain-containing protein [unclassified Myroides]MDM1043941.1 GAF domain-containing protein [Myroides sp. R163-1]MDM1054876.1 GAF domain-containing protein [Myroides sp. 1354]MDM1068173.1 GAF domain-containing protein [Myroides sp. 1372]